MTNALKYKDVLIHCYKHNGEIHRCWDKGFVLEETAQHFIVVNNKTLVTESDGRRWYTREPAVCYFPKNAWFNVICMIRKTGVHYYVNIASPTLYDGEAIKYIDYDLDVKIFPDYQYKVLDEEEFIKHSQIMGYPKDLMAILTQQLEEVIQMANAKQGPFEEGFAEKWYQLYHNVIGH